MSSTSPRRTAIAIASALALASVTPAGCTKYFSPWGEEATLVLEWTVDGAPAEEVSCQAAGADRVRMAINSEPVDWFDERLEWSCETGSIRLEEMFRTGLYYVRWDLLDADREIIRSTDWRAVELAPGETEITDISL